MVPKRNKFQVFGAGQHSRLECSQGEGESFPELWVIPKEHSRLEAISRRGPQLQKSQPSPRLEARVRTDIVKTQKQTNKQM